MQDAPPRLSVRLLEILRCPVSRTQLVYDQATDELLSLTVGLAYPVRAGVPIMVADAARALDAG